MPEEFKPGPEHAQLEADISRLSTEVLRVKDYPESQGLSGPEIVKKTLWELPLPVARPAPADSGLLPGYMEDAPPEIKLEVETLLDMAFHKGIFDAEAEARKHEPFVLDAFRDALAGRLYPEFKRRGILD